VGAPEAFGKGRRSETDVKRGKGKRESQQRRCKKGTQSRVRLKRFEDGSSAKFSRRGASLSVSTATSLSDGSSRALFFSFWSARRASNASERASCRYAVFGPRIASLIRSSSSTRTSSSSAAAPASSHRCHARLNSARRRSRGPS
jgi:hypothetical protein